MQNLVSEAKRNRFATVPKLTDEDVVSVWDGVSNFIGKNMALQKGVAIPSLGIFTFSQRKLDVGNNKYILIQRPVFQLSEKFAMTHALQTTKYHTDGQIPIVPLNFAALSSEMDFDRDTVEGCVKEMLQALSRSVQSKRNVEFVFTGIGRLTIKNLRVKMKFHKEFLQGIDQSGNLINALKNRPETCDSVMSGMSTPFLRPSTSNTIVLPRISPGEDLNSQGSNSEKKLSPLNANVLPMTTITEENDAIRSGNGDNYGFEAKLLDQDIGPLEPSRCCSPIRLQTAPEKTMLNRASSRLEVQPAQAAVTFTSPSSDRSKLKTPLRAPPRALKSISKTAFEDSGNEKVIDGFVPTKKSQMKAKVFDKTCSNCLHDAGQEMCYLCYQRQRRNIPVYLHEEKKKKEMEEDRLLQQYQHLKDYEAILKDQDIKVANRDEAQKIAAFNLGASEAIKGKKNERPTDFHRSYVFYKRSVSPPFHLAQNKYHTDLAGQVRQKAVDETKTRRSKDFLERLEQVELAKDLAAQREQYLRNKKLQSEEYRKALDTQIYIKKCIERQLLIDNERPCKGLTMPEPNIIQPFTDSSGKLRSSRRSKSMMPKLTMRFRPLPLPAAEPDSEGPYFGKHDIHHDKMAGKRIRARHLYEDQLRAAAEKKRNAILNDLKNQKEESDMLSQARKDLLEESVYRNNEQVNIRQELEDTWLQASKMKKFREKDEKRRSQSPGILLHEQCNKYYSRCKECKRKMANCGESNVWCESRYLSGSRIMV